MSELKKTILRKGGSTIKTTNYIVKSIGFDFKTHKTYGISYENIDLVNNKMFSDCKTEWDIEDTYENFWNRLNDIESDWYLRRKEIWKVVEVYPIQKFSYKFPRTFRNLKEREFRLYPVELFDNPKQSLLEIFKVKIKTQIIKIKNLLNMVKTIKLPELK